MLPIDFERAVDICGARRLVAVREGELWLRVEERPPRRRPDSWTPRAQSVCCLSEGVWDALEVLRATAEIENIVPASIWKPPYFKEWNGLKEDTIAQVFAIMGIAPYFKKPGRPERYRSWPLYRILSGRPIGSRHAVVYKVAFMLVRLGLARIKPGWNGLWSGPEARVQWLSPALQQPLTPEAEEALATFQ